MFTSFIYFTVLIEKYINKRSVRILGLEWLVIRVVGVARGDELALNKSGSWRLKNLAYARAPAMMDLLIVLACAGRETELEDNCTPKRKSP